MDQRDARTHTSAFGVGRREGHDAAAFYARFQPPVLSDDEQVNRPVSLLAELGSGRLYTGSSTNMTSLPDNSVALVVTSPPYFVGKEYELAVTGELGGGARVPGTYFEFLDMLRNVFAECVRVLEPGGRIAVNVANLGRKPYRSLSADVISILQDDLGLLLRGEVIWEKAEASAGSCAWGSFAKASNPVLRDMTERVIIASKGRFSRAVTVADRKRLGLPHESTLANDEFVDVTRDVWRIDAESATRVGHPAPFPVELPRRLIDLYTYRDDIVLDPFAGSGTTLVAAARTGRIGVGYDLDPAYIDLGERRLQAELQRAATLRAVNQTIENAAPEIQLAEMSKLSSDDRQEHFQARAVNEGRKAQDIARRLLGDAGFATINDKAKPVKGLIEFDFQITSPNGARQWWVDVSGAFTSSRPGLQRTDTLWKMLGRLLMLTANEDGESRRDQRGGTVLVLTSNRPKPGSPGDRALRHIGPGFIFDVIELYDPAGFERLHHYANDPEPTALPGFWTAKDLAAGAP